VLHGDRQRLLGFSSAEHPVVLQLGGSDPRKLAAAARIGAEFGYDAINLNCGCPSDRVQDGRFGACLMREPDLVGDCIAEMRAAAGIAVTVKCRLGVDDQDVEESLDRFADAVVRAGADGLVVHARKAWLKGLSPKENRDVPPLDYGRVRRLKQWLGTFQVALNGGIVSVAEGQAQLAETAPGRPDGVMLGRAAYHRPADLLAVDPLFHGEPPPLPDAFAAAETMIGYAESACASGTRLAAITRHMLGLFHDRPGARRWRRVLTIDAARPGADARVIRDALAGLMRTHSLSTAAE
jgi:tRNA-dihydrouridine synthase A